MLWSDIAKFEPIYLQQHNAMCVGRPTLCIKLNSPSTVNHFSVGIVSSCCLSLVEAVKLKLVRVKGKLE